MKLHLGCGKKYLAGYVHIDLATYPHIEYKAPVNSLPMIPDASAELIYASHVFEYFDRVEAKAVLAEWRRVLKPGGILRLAVPDFEALLKVYNTTGDIERVIGPLYGRWPIPGSDATVYHKTVYDKKSLSKLLLENGFASPQNWDWREVFQGENLGFDDYSQAYFPHMEKTSGLLISLNLEAQKA